VLTLIGSGGGPGHVGDLDLSSLPFIFDD
jgi:hypothetical protein